MSTVQCDHALAEDGQEIHISAANRGGNYKCLSCGFALMARKGKHNEDHFAHKNTEVERPCTYSSETYRHAKAKQLLVARLRVQVPAVYAAIPVGYEGKVPRLTEAREIVAATAVSEQNVYVDEQGAVQFERHYSLPFDDHQGKRQLLARPDVVFYDQDKNPVLFIEI